VKVKVKGFVAKIRQGTDGGMSWGPAAMLRWSDTSGLRIGTRSDGNVQGDILGLLGQQRLFPGCDGGRWVWLRARWLDRRGIMERSDDGVNYEHLWTFDHGGAFNGEAAELLVGKVPYNGQPKDHTDAGSTGESDIAFVELYGR